MALFRRRRPTHDHPYFGRLTFMEPDYWEGELVLEGAAERVGLVVPAPATGPVEAQVELCRRLLGEPERLLERCRPVLEGTYEEWAGTPLPEDWKGEFTLVGLGLPADGNEAAPWDVTYFVEAASHYFTVPFVDGRAQAPVVDG